jgi:hypothetical protein|nr:hypothetical protein [Neorhizobium tomejilense]
MMTEDVNKLIAELVGAPMELFIEDRAVDLMRRAANALRSMSTNTSSSAPTLPAEGLQMTGGAALASHYSPRTDTQDFIAGFEAGYQAAAKVFELPDAHAIAKAISRSYGEEPDDLAPRERMMTADNLQVPCWKVYEEQAFAVTALFPRGRPMVIVKPLEWRDQGNGHFVASAPLFGRIRVEHFGGDYCVSYSVPGYSDSFVAGNFQSPDTAKEAADAEYQRRMRLAFAIDTAFPARVREVAFNTLCYGARFRYREADTVVWVKIGHDTVAKWDADKVADTWIGQSVCSFSEDDDLTRTVILVPDCHSSVPLSHAPVTTADLADLLAKAGTGPWEIMSQNGDPEEFFRGIASPRRTNSLGKEYQTYVAQYCEPNIASLVVIAPQLAAEVLAHRASLPSRPRADVIDEAAKVLDERVRAYEEQYQKETESSSRSANLAAIAALEAGAINIRALLSRTPY